jgi:hypothetical protein
MFYFFPIDFVYSQKVNNHNQIKTKILKEINLRKNTEEPCWELSKLTTSFRNTKEYNEFLYSDDIANDIVWNPLNNMFKEIKDIINFSWATPKSSIISNSWYNIYEKGDCQEIHEHISSYNTKSYIPSFSMIYIVDNEGQKNTTVFRKRFPLTGKSPHVNAIYDTANCEDIVEGTVMIFPYHLEHYVLPETNKKITCSYNIRTIF